MSGGTEPQSFAFAEPRNVQSIEDCIFYHSLDLPGHGEIMGEWDLRGRFDDYVGGVDVRGKSVLDIGTASGFLTFEAERRGASSVVSFDIADANSQHLLPFKDKLYYRDHELWRSRQNAGYERWKNAYWLAHRLFHSRAKAFYGDIYHLPPAAGSFDVVIVGSVLEHLSDQVSALASIARLAAHTMILVTDVIETEDPIARFLPRADRPEMDYTWWLYSIGIYREVLGMLGFGIDRITKGRYRFNAHRFGGEAIDAERPTLVATRR